MGSLTMMVKCAHCGRLANKTAKHVNRARNVGAPLFCGLKCFGLSRRTHKTKAQKAAEKRCYDMEYRQKNLAALKEKKRAYHKRTYDPVKAALERKKRMRFHVEYCRQPSYRAWKREYDRRRRDGEYGAFAEAARLTIQLNSEIKERTSNEQIKWQNQTANKAQFRRRADKAPERSRSRYRDRRDRHQAAFSR